MEETYYDKKLKRNSASYRACAVSLVGVIICLVIALLMCSSCATKHITVPEIHTEYITKHDSVMMHDSIHVHDSVVIKQTGDTIFCDRWHTLYKDRWRDRVLIDSIIKTDSVAVPYPVEKKLTKWQQIKLDFGEIFIIISVIFCFIMSLLYLRRNRQRNQ